ncbi:unnamed protein product, partial [Amoebophrya sp. A25]
RTTHDTEEDDLRRAETKLALSQAQLQSTKEEKSRLEGDTATLRGSLEDVEGRERNADETLLSEGGIFRKLSDEVSALREGLTDLVAIGAARGGGTAGGQAADLAGVGADELEGEIRAAESHKTTAKSAYQAAEGRTLTERQRSDAITGQVEGLERTQQEFEGERTTLEREIREAEDATKKLRNAKTASEKSQIVHRELEQAQGEARASAGKVAVLQEEIERLNEPSPGDDLEQLQRELHEAKATAVAERERLGETEGEVVSLRRDIEALSQPSAQSPLRDLEDRVRDAETEAQTAEDAYNLLKDRVKLREELQEATARAAEARRDLVAAAASLEDKNAEVERLTGAINQIRASAQSQEAGGGLPSSEGQPGDPRVLRRLGEELEEAERKLGEAVREYNAEKDFVKGEEDTAEQLRKIAEDLRRKQEKANEHLERLKENKKLEEEIAELQTKFGAINADPDVNRRLENDDQVKTAKQRLEEAVAAEEAIEAQARAADNEANAVGREAVTAKNEREEENTILNKAKEKAQVKRGALAVAERDANADARRLEDGRTLEADELQRVRDEVARAEEEATRKKELLETAEKERDDARAAAEAAEGAAKGAEDAAQVQKENADTAQAAEQAANEAKRTADDAAQAAEADQATAEGAADTAETAAAEAKRKGNEAKEEARKAKEEEEKIQEALAAENAAAAAASEAAQTAKDEAETAQSEAAEATQQKEEAQKTLDERKEELTGQQAALDAAKTAQTEAETELQAAREEENKARVEHRQVFETKAAADDVREAAQEDLNAEVIVVRDNKEIVETQEEQAKQALRAVEDQAKQLQTDLEAVDKKKEELETQKAASLDETTLTGGCNACAGDETQLDSCGCDVEKLTKEEQEEKEMLNRGDDFVVGSFMEDGGKKFWRLPMSVQDADAWFLALLFFLYLGFLVRVYRSHRARSKVLQLAARRIFAAAVELEKQREADRHERKAKQDLEEHLYRQGKDAVRAAARRYHSCCSNLFIASSGMLNSDILAMCEMLSNKLDDAQLTKQGDSDGKQGHSNPHELLRRIQGYYKTLPES